MSKMRKSLALLLAAAMMLALAACGGDSGSNANANTNPGKAAETPTPEFVYAADFIPMKTSSDQYFSVRLTTPEGFYGTQNEVVGQRELSEGEVLEYEGQLDIYAERLYFMGLDGSMTLLENYEPMEIEAEGASEGNVGTWTQSMALSPEGNLVCLNNAWWSIDNAPEGVEPGSDEWYGYQEYHDEYYDNENNMED